MGACFSFAKKPLLLHTESAPCPAAPFPGHIPHFLELREVLLRWIARWHLSSLVTRFLFISNLRVRHPSGDDAPPTQGHEYGVEADRMTGAGVHHDA